MGFDSRRSVKIELSEAIKYLKYLQSKPVQDAVTRKLIKEQKEYIKLIEKELREGVMA